MTKQKEIHWTRWPKKQTRLSHVKNSFLNIIVVCVRVTSWKFPSSSSPTRWRHTCVWLWSIDTDASQKCLVFIYGESFLLHCSAGRCEFLNILLWSQTLKDKFSIYGYAKNSKYFLSRLLIWTKYCNWKVLCQSEDEIGRDCIIYLENFANSSYRYSFM